MSRAPLRRIQSGAALILVLWLIVLLAGVVGACALAARVEHLQTRSGLSLLQGGEMARAGLEYGLYRLSHASLDQPVWQADGRVYAWQFNGVPVEVRLQSESGKVDLNHADPTLLSALLVQAGAPPAQAGRIAAAIIDWRDADDLVQPGGGAEAGQYVAAGLPYGPANGPFVTVGELRRVMGMDEALFQTLVPWVTVWSDRLQPEPSLAPAEVLRAMGQDPEPWLARRRPAPEGQAAVPTGPIAAGDTFSIDSRARLVDGRDVRLRAVVRTGTASAVGPAYVALQWQQGMEAR